MFLRYASGQTDRQTDTLTTILRCRTEQKVISDNDPCDSDGKLSVIGTETPPVILSSRRRFLHCSRYTVPRRRRSVYRIRQETERRPVRMRSGSESLHDVIPRRRDCCHGYISRQADAATEAVDIRARTRLEVAAAEEEFYFRSRDLRREMVLCYHSMSVEHRSSAHNTRVHRRI